MAGDGGSTGQKRKREIPTIHGHSDVRSMSPAATLLVAQDSVAEKQEPETPNHVVAPKRYNGAQRTLNKGDPPVTQFFIGTNNKEKENAKLFWLSKTDQEAGGAWGIVHHVPLMMVYVLGGNRRGVFLTSDKEGKKGVVREPHKDVMLKGDRYYCWAKGGT